MRDAKEALRHRVDYLEDELAEKEAELARLRAEAEGATDAKHTRAEPATDAATAPMAPEPVPTAEPPAPPELRFGKLQPDGAVRYVVRPVDVRWVAIMTAAAVVVVAAVGREMVSDGKGFPWIMPVIFGILPFAPTFRAGFDIHVQQKSIYVWRSWGPITYSSFTLRRLRLPEVRSGVETHTSGDGSESRGRVTRLYWTNENIRSTLDRSKLSELMDEVRALVASATR